MPPRARVYSTTNAQIVYVLIGIFAGLLKLNMSLTSVTDFKPLNHVTLSKAQVTQLSIAQILLVSSNVITLVCLLVIMMIAIEVAFVWVFGTDAEKGPNGKRVANAAHECFLLMVLVLGLVASILRSVAIFADDLWLWIVGHLWSSTVIAGILVIGYPFGLFLRRRFSADFQRERERERERED